jgi:hypothetical protein
MDSSQISNWFECSQRWANRGLIAINKKEPELTLQPGEAMAAGSLGHKYLEIYYQILAETGNSELAARSAFAFDPDKADKVEKQFPLDQKLRDLVRTRFSNYLTYYSAKGDYIPATRFVPHIITKNGVLADSTRKEALVEKGFSYKLYESSEYLFILEGRIDFLGKAQDGTYFWMDHKWQFKEHELYAKSIQFRNYSLATGLYMAVINYVRLHKEIKTNTFVRQPLSFSAYELKCWKQELIEIYVQIAKQVREQDFPKNRAACGHGWGGGCQFIPLCDERNASIRATIQKRDFMSAKEWRPW